MYKEYDRDLIDYEINSDFIHFSHIPKISHAQDFMQNVFAVLYGDLSIDELETNLEEVCAVLGMNLPSSALKVTKQQ